jgi:hypothetical protein
MASAAASSYFLTPPIVHASNSFSFGPIREVAIVFAGIFATMPPALDWLQNNAAQMGDPTPAFYFTASGTLSSVLDNAPTYLTFLSAILAQIEQAIRDHGTGLVAMRSQHAEPVRQTLATIAQYHLAVLTSGSARPDQIGICFLSSNAAYHKLILALSIGAVFSEQTPILEPFAGLLMMMASSSDFIEAAANASVPG